MQQIITLAFLCISIPGIAQNVGIGEVAPLAKLHLKTLDSAVLLVENNTVTGSNIKTGLYFKTGASYSGYIATIGGGYTHRMGLFTYGGVQPSSLVERLTISDNGNVGIGTISPAAKLEVNGQLKITGGNPGAGKILESDLSGLATWVDKPSGGGSLPAGALGNTLRHDGISYVTATNFYNSGYRIGLGTTTPGTLFEIKAATGTEATMELNATDGNNAILRINRGSLSSGAVIRFNLGGVNNWDVGPNGDANFKVRYVPSNSTALELDDATRNISIGTNDFTDKLNVAGNISAYGAVISKASNAGFQFQDRTTNTYGGWNWYADGGKANLFRYGGLGNALTIDATGKLGLGVATPTSPLSFPTVIGKKISLYPGPTGDAGFGVFGNELRVNTDYNGADVTFGFDNFTNGFTERMRIKGTGNVGIGTNNPLDKLEVRGSLGEGIRVSSTSQTVEMTTGLFGANVGTTTASALNFITNGSIAAAISSAGNMGIGVTGAAYKLDVNGRVRLRHNGASSGIWYNTSTNVEAGFVGQYTDNLWGVYGNNSWKFAVNETDGTVYLGSPNLDAENLNVGSGYRLKVFGKIISEEVRVQLKSAWPDYVFEPGYQRLSIDDFAKYLSDNKHLPNMPSAKEVEDNGQHVGEMQRKMMEKIEELSLYIIDLKKEIDLLNKKIN